MATNSFFRNYKSQNEQKLINDLVVESIKMYGIDTYYVAKRLDAIDNVLNEASSVTYDRSFEMEMYVKSFDSFEGDGDIMSGFGLEIRDQLTLSVAITTFEKYVLPYDAVIKRPREGDIVYFPMNDKYFKINFVEHESVFYQGGKLFVYDLKCELMEFSNERFETGVPQIDEHHMFSRTENISDMETLYDIDPISKNIFFENETEDMVDNSEFDPFKDIDISSLRKQED